MNQRTKTKLLEEERFHSPRLHARGERTPINRIRPHHRNIMSVIRQVRRCRRGVDSEQVDGEIIPKLVKLAKIPTYRKYARK